MVLAGECELHLRGKREGEKAGVAGTTLFVRARGRALRRNARAAGRLCPATSLSGSSANNGLPLRGFNKRNKRNDNDICKSNDGRDFESCVHADNKARSLNKGLQSDQKFLFVVVSVMQS